MAIIVDLVILAIMALCVIFGYIRGLTGSLIKIVSFVLSLIIAFVLFIPVSSIIINNTQLDENIENTIREAILQEDQIENNQSGTQEENNNKNIPEAITEYIGQKVDEASDDAKETVVNSTARDVSLTIVKAGTWIVLFIVARILLILLRFITSLITKLPVIKQFDKLRWSYLWNIRRFGYNICITCNNFIYLTYA